MRYLKWIIAVLALLPLSALAFYKPTRLVIPQAFGVSCSEANICVDDPTRLAAATQLVAEAKQFLRTRWNLSAGRPRIVFCSTAKCQHTFGHAKAAGFTFGSVGIVIEPRGWKRYYVAHELIHYWQSRTFGTLVRLRAKPWIIEGMAYSLSGDPRKPLHEPFETYRRKFAEWQRSHSGAPLRQSLGNLLRNGG